MSDDALVRDNRTLNARFAECVRRHGGRTALRRQASTGWADISWQAYAKAVARIGHGLIALNLRRGDRVVILSNSRVEWLFAELAILGVGGVTVPIHPSVSEQDVAYILADCTPRLVILEDKSNLDKLNRALACAECATVKGPEMIVTFDDVATSDSVLTLEQLVAAGDRVPEEAFGARAKTAKAEDLVTIVYTSGTTGEQKGVMITHQNCVSQCEASNPLLGLSEEDVVMSCLPLAHMFGRLTHWRSLHAGNTTVYAALDSALADVTTVRPTLLPMVPRFFEKLREALLRRVDAQWAPVRVYLRAALSWNLGVDRHIRNRLQLSLLLKIKKCLATPAVWTTRKWARRMTGGRLRILYAGGAPLGLDLAEFFHSLGLVVIEAYGMTESTGPIYSNCPRQYRLGSVGRLVPGVDAMLAPDGEILVRGPTVTQGYFRNTKASDEAFDSDGWFHTGDLAELDGAGYLVIIGRKKDLIKTAGGKHVAPQKIESLMRSIRGVSSVAVFGDMRKYCVALVTVDPDTARDIVAEHGQRPSGELNDLMTHEEVYRTIARGIAEKNRLLASYETVKYFRIIPKPPEIGAELTSTLKVRRKYMAEKYARLIDEMYKD